MSTPKAKRTAAGAPQGLADHVMAVLMKAEGPLRAGEINQVLGRPESAGSRESVRSGLDRLVSADQAERRGRGLYEAAAN